MVGAICALLPRTIMQKRVLGRSGLEVWAFSDRHLGRGRVQAEGGPEREVAAGEVVVTAPARDRIWSGWSP